MIRNAMLLPALLLVTFAANAHAGDGRESRLGGTISLFGGNTPALDFLTQTRDVVGARCQLHVPLRQGKHWTFSPGFGYGYGLWKVDQTSTTSPYTDQFSVSTWDATLDFLHGSGCCDDGGLYCGPGLFYSSSTIEEKEKVTRDFADITYPPYRTFGVQLTVGGGIPVSPKLELTGSMTQRAGLSSFDRKDSSFGTGEARYSGITHSTQFGVGVRLRF